MKELGTNTEVDLMIENLRLNFTKKRSNDLYILYNTFFSDILYSYLKTTLINVIYNTNTFYFRNDKINFINHYYPITCSNSNSSLTLDNPHEELLNQNHIVIQGLAGAGKTSMAKYCFFNSIIEGKAIPLYIQLRNLNAFINNYGNKLTREVIETSASTTGEVIKIKKNVPVNIFMEFLYSIFYGQWNYTIDQELTFRRLLNDGEFILILDGYDEIHTENLANIKNSINEFINLSKKNIIILTSRIGTKINFNINFNVHRVDKLGIKGIKSVIRLLNKDKPERALTIIKSIDENKETYLLEIISNPLLLTMFVFSFETYPEIPTKRSEFYSNVFTTLYSTHKTNQGIDKIVRQTKLTHLNFENCLAAISYVTYKNGDYNFSEEKLINLLSNLKANNFIKEDFKEEELLNDITISISILINDSGVIFYPHRSLQEYFAALFIYKQRDSDVKNKLFRALREEKFRHSNDNSKTFFDILYELDESAVKEYYVLDSLNECLQTKQLFGEIELISNFLEYFNFEITILLTSERKNFANTTILIPNNKIFDSLIYLGYFKAFSNLETITKIDSLEFDINNAIQSSKDIRDTLLEELTYNPISNVSILYFMKLHEDLNEIIISHFANLDLEKTFFSLIEKEIQEIKQDIKLKETTIDLIINL